MPDEPSLGEISRRVDGVVAMTAQLVQRAEFAAEQRVVDRRFMVVENDVADLQRSFLDEVKGIKAALDSEVKGFKGALDAAVVRLEAADEKREDKRGGSLRAFVYAGLIPSILVLVATVVQIWAALRGA